MAYTIQVKTKIKTENIKTQKTVTMTETKKNITKITHRILYFLHSKSHRADIRWSLAIIIKIQIRMSFGSS